MFQQWNGIENENENDGEDWGAGEAGRSWKKLEEASNRSSTLDRAPVEASSLYRASTGRKLAKPRPFMTMAKQRPSRFEVRKEHKIGKG